MSDLSISYQLTPDLETAVSHAVEQMQQNDIISRIWQQDHTVWQASPDEITDPNRLGWLDIADRMADELDAIRALRDEVIDAGFSDVVLLGMGGSSLAPEVFYTIFGGDGLKLTVLDSTSPDAVMALADRLNVSRTLFIVSSKSGGTVETLSFFKFFYGLAVEALGLKTAGDHFVAITDPDSKLERLGRDLDFRRIFVNDPDIGGRYSALSFFGLVPAALVGVDLSRLLARATAMAAGPGRDLSPNSAAYLGAVLGTAAKHGRDKLTLIMPPQIAAFGYWLEQLIAESTGKEGHGILPVEGEPVGAPGVYGDDRIFVYLHPAGPDENYEAALAVLSDAGHPVIRIRLADLYDLGGEMWRWEMATAVAGHVLGINPFDQPNVESAKIQARKLTDAYARSGELPEQAPAIRQGETAVYGDTDADTVETAVDQFLAQIQPGDYVAIQAYLPATPEIADRLLGLRTAVRDNFHVATTVGYGPRFLHSTGQLHKGDAGDGLFLVITGRPERDAAIPRDPASDQSDLTFGVLIRAQALGDMGALRDAGRRVLRLHFGDDVLAGLAELREWVG